MSLFFLSLTVSLAAVCGSDGRSTPGHPCTPGRTGKYPHRTCQAFYDCSVTYERVPPFFEQHLVECPYPMLYDTNTQSCEPYQTVDCGNRQLFLDGCDYFGNKCDAPTCYPCEMRFPPCVGLSDGSHPFKTPNYYRRDHYILCKDERFVDAFACGVDDLGETLFFDTNTRKCGKLYD